MSKSGTMVVNEEAANAEPRFVAPDLVAADDKGRPALAVGRCSACHALSFPRAAICTTCLSEDVETTTVSAQGTLYSYSIVHQAPKGWNVPYTLGYVDLPGDLRVLAHLDVAADKIAINMPMRLAIGIVGTDAAGTPLMSYTFVPA